MAEWLMRGTVNTFFRGSIPLDTLNPLLKKKNINKIKKRKFIPNRRGRIKEEY
jgi:hypothetical protein